MGISFNCNSTIERSIQDLLNKKLKKYWNSEVKTLVKNAIVCKGKDGKDLGIPGCYFMFHNKNYCMRALSEFLTTRNYDIKLTDVNAKFKTWLQKTASKGDKKTFSKMQNIYSRKELEQQRKDFLELHASTEAGDPEKPTTPTEAENPEEPSTSTKAPAKTDHGDKGGVKQCQFNSTQV